MYHQRRVIQKKHAHCQRCGNHNYLEKLPRSPGEPAGQDVDANVTVFSECEAQTQHNYRDHQVATVFIGNQCGTVKESAGPDLDRDQGHDH